MNISNNIENLTQIFEPQTTGSASSAKTPVQNEAQNQTRNTDQAQLSATASQVAQSAAGSDVRLDKVAGIQSALQAGTYSVPASAVAQKVISSLLTTDK